MIVQTTTKYNYGDILSTMFRKYRPGSIQVGRVTAIRVYQSEHFRKDAYSIEYCLMPFEFCNTECDEEEWIGECNILNSKLI